MAANEITWPTGPDQLADLTWMPLSGAATGVPEQHDKADSVYDQSGPQPAAADAHFPVGSPILESPAPAVSVAPAEAADVEVVLTAAERAEERRKASAARAAAEFRAKAKQLTRISRCAMGAVILISAIITAFGAGNANDLFALHHTGEPWAWLPYPALEAGLIVEIQIGGFLGEHKRVVKFWGAALRFVTALAAITLCFYGPAEQLDWAGAGIHAIGPFVQFFLAEYLAHARAQFRSAIDELLALADGRKNAADTDLLARTAAAPSTAKDRTKRRAEKRPSVRPSRPSVPSAADGRSPAPPQRAAAVRPSVLDPSVDEELLVRARTAADHILSSGQRLNRDNLVQAIRAGGGTCPNKMAGTVLAIVRAEHGGPDLRPIAQQGA